MRTIEHYVLINGKVICELVTKDEQNISRVSVGTGPMDRDASAVELQNGVRPKVSPTSGTSNEQ